MLSFKELPLLCKNAEERLKAPPLKAEHVREETEPNMVKTELL